MTPSAIEEPPPTASNGTVDDASAKPPPNVVLPPKDIRAIVEKTAGYVARNGASFEERIRAKEISNAKFAFLNESDAYYSFYAWRLDEVRAGRGTVVSAGREGEAPGATAAAAAAAAQEAENKAKGPDPPPEFGYSARMPNINSQDLDVVRVTAEFVAKNGRSFMTALSQKEAGNYQFDFLRPQHSLYQFFSRLVDQYTELLNPLRAAKDIEARKQEEKRLADLRRKRYDRTHVLERNQHRSEWVKYQEQQKQQREEEAEAEKIAYAQIDWHDFVVVESVLFDESDDQAQLPPPTSLSDLQSASLEQKAAMSIAPHTMRIEEAMPGDVDMNGYTDQYQQQYHQQQQIRPPPQASPVNTMPAPFQPPSAFSPQPTTASPYNPPAPLETNRLATQPQQPPQQPPNPANINIRTDYTPRVLRKNAAGPTSLCPRCNQQIPTSQIDEHMRIELLDPRWKEQRAKADSRYSTTNLSTADVANNLKRLASQRTDVFDGVTGEMISEEERERRKRAATRYDGRIPGVEGHGPKGNPQSGLPGVKAPGSAGGWGAGGGPGGGALWNQGQVGGGGAGGVGWTGGGATGSHVGWAPAAQAQQQQQAQSASIEEQIKHIREKAKQ